jgi:hypothetical protein
MGSKSEFQSVSCIDVRHENIDFFVLLMIASAQTHRRGPCATTRHGIILIFSLIIILLEQEQRIAHMLLSIERRE